MTEPIEEESLLSIETERLILRPFRPTDGDNLFALYGDIQVMSIRKIGLQTRSQSDRQLDDILAHWRRFGFGLSAVIVKTGGAFIGECGLRQMTPGEDEIELSYGLVPSAWGQGFATEASVAVLATGFGRLGLETIHAAARADNMASHRVLKKLGFEQVCEERKYEVVVARFILDRQQWLTSNCRSVS